MIKNFGSLTIETGKDQTETVTGILNLLTPQDANLKPLIDSDLYKLLMTFNITRNADVVHNEAYESLLACTLSYIFSKEAISSFDEDILKQIHETLQI